MRISKTYVKGIINLLATLVICPQIFAQVPQIISYQGRVSVNGTNFTGTGQFNFALINASAATTYWSNGVNTVALPVSMGLYSVLLGDTTVANMSAIPQTVFTNNDVRLRVWFDDGVNGQELLASGQRIAAAGYAFRSTTADNATQLAAQLASSGNVNDFGNPVDWSQLKNMPASFASGICVNSLNGMQGAITIAAGTGVAVSSGGSIVQISTSPHVHPVADITGTFSSPGKVANNATTATSANTPSAIVARDGSGNFTSGTITANLAGNADSATVAAKIPNYSSAPFAATAPTVGSIYLDTAAHEVKLSDGSQWQSLIPVGSVMPYMGTTSPNGWLLCDGSAISRSSYAALFSVIGTASGSGDGSTTFDLPDMRGMFLRGAAGSLGASGDPDNSSRTAQSSGGNTGNAVGSVQTDQLRLHSHTFTMSSINNFQAPSYIYIPGGAGFGNIFGTQFPAATTIGATGGNESRPKNVYVNYIIKY